VNVQVPFDFAMGDKTYPAAEYAFSSMKDTVILENSGGARIAMVLAGHASGGSAGKTGKAIFECYADGCFISQIWIPGPYDGLELLRAHKETQIAANQSRKYLALLGTSSSR
jgi:hypothetical protein